MLISSILNLGFIPVLYVLFKTLLEKFSKPKPPLLLEPPTT